MSGVTAPRGLGRPKSETKRAAIIEAAARLFQEQSFDSVTMDQVASAAGVAKMTLYSHFADKDALFEATVLATSDLLVSALPRLAASGDDFEEELVQFGCTFLKVILNPGLVKSMHFHFDALSRNRPLAERFFEAGPGRTHARLAAYLASSAAGRLLSQADAREAAGDLMSLWLRDFPQQLALRLMEPLSSEDLARHVRRCTRLIIRANGLDGR